MKTHPSDILKIYQVKQIQIKLDNLISNSFKYNAYVATVKYSQEGK